MNVGFTSSYQDRH